MTTTLRVDGRVNFWRDVWTVLRDLAWVVLITFGFGATAAVLCFIVALPVFAVVQVAHWLSKMLAG